MFRRIFHDFVIITLLATGFSLAQTGQSIFHDKIGAETAKMCGNKGHSVIELWNGYRIDCQMQDLQVEITITGTIIRSNSKSEGAGVFSIRAAQLGRKRLMTELPPEVDWVNANKNLVSCKRLNVVEEYTTSSDGIRQDFVIMDRPRGKGKLLLALAVEDADPILLGKEV
ncbi:MAG: hypothetical protein JW863_05880, partial [Chitinispirillaceae bacterium]|nr:hypothetical protein [Chitinispirillaceae bacterium]